MQADLGDYVDPRQQPPEADTQYRFDRYEEREQLPGAQPSQYAQPRPLWQDEPAERPRWLQREGSGTDDDGTLPAPLGLLAGFAIS